MEKEYWTSLLKIAFDIDHKTITAREFALDKIMATPNDNTVACGRAKGLVKVWRSALNSDLTNQAYFTKALIEIANKYADYGVWVRL